MRNQRNLEALNKFESGGIPMSHGVLQSSLGRKIKPSDFHYFNGRQGAAFTKLLLLLWLACARNGTIRIIRMASQEWLVSRNITTTFSVLLVIFLVIDIVLVVA